MAKSFPKPTPQVTPANHGQPPRFVPGATSPLDQTARNFAPRIPVQSAQEQRRAESLPGSIASGGSAPRYGDVPARPPFPERVAVATNPAPGPKAGGSKTN
jgi:hypothetical protein